MEKIILNESDLDMAYKNAYYFRHPERVLHSEKEMLHEAIAKNPDIHYKTLEINRIIWRKAN